MRHKPDQRPLMLQDWEQEVTADVAAALTPSKRAAHPSRVHTRADLPAGAFEALEQALGPLREEDLIIIPAGARAVSADQRRYVYAPAQVLAACERGAALWVEHPAGPGVRVTIPVEQVLAVDEEHILLVARLSVLGVSARLTVYYNAVGRPLLQPPLRRLRGAAPAGLLPMPQAWTDVEHLPVKWRSALTASLLHPDDPVTSVWGEVPTAASGARRGCLLALTPGELIVIRDPEEVSAAAAYGLDSLCVPRRCIERAQVAGGELKLNGEGTEMSISLGAKLAAEVGDRMGGLLPFAAASESGR